jgi:hypothetical protein
MKVFLAGGQTYYEYIFSIGGQIDAYSKSMDIYLDGDRSRLEGVEKWKYTLPKQAHSLELSKSTIEMRGGYSGDSKKKDIFSRANILQSFYYADEWTERMIPHFKNFLLDSGAFTFFSAGKDVDWVQYIRDYADFINRNNIQRFFELDIDALIGYEKVVDYRKMLEDLTGKAVIPVWHKSRGKDNFHQMCEEYKYVSIGGIVSKEIKRNEYPVFKYLINEAHKQGCKIHGLGFTNLKGLEEYKFDSVDSTAWVSGNRFGHIYKFNGMTMEKVNKQQGQRLKNDKEVAYHNFTEWVKFSEYAERML